MGRVYNALRRAERLTDSKRPIGRPDRPVPVIEEAGVLVDASPQPVAGVSAGRLQGASSEGSVQATQRIPRAVPSEAPPALKPGRTAPAAPRTGYAGGPRLDSVSPDRLLERPGADATLPGFVEPRRVVNAASLRIAPHLAALFKGRQESGNAVE